MSSTVRPPAPLDQLRDLELLLNAHHPVVFLETLEDERAEVLLQHIAEHLGLGFFVWSHGRGVHHLVIDSPVEGSESPKGCLLHVLNSPQESLYLLRDFARLAHDDDVRVLLKDVHRKLWEHRGAVVITGASVSELPDDIARLATTVTLRPPTDREYHRFLSDLLRDMRRRKQIDMNLSREDLVVLIQQLRGLTFFEVRKVVTQAIADGWTLDARAIDAALEAKKDVIKRTGVLEYTPAEQSLADVAGLESLKRWLRRRRTAFQEPGKAREFGLSPPRGVLLLGVPGCGKSLSAKAVASEYRLPLIRLDPSRLYTKFVGETEQNLRRAMRAAESMAPIVLWVDEIEKGLGPSGGGGGDAGLSTRMFGTFLSWLQEKPDGVFVVATANDVSGLPPELLRKGRFDEIFFVDLPTESIRSQIFALHLERRKRPPTSFDLAACAKAAVDFSGAEIEQVIVSALYAAYESDTPLTTEHLLREIASTRPLAVTSREKIDTLRRWAKGRAVSADFDGPQSDLDEPE